MDKDSVLYLLMDLRLNTALDGAMTADGEYQAIMKKSDEYSKKLDAMHLSEDVMDLIDHYVSEQNALGARGTAPQKIMCKRYSTKSRISHLQCCILGLIPLVFLSPGRLGRVCAPNGVNAVTDFREFYCEGNQPTFRSANIISN